MMWSNIEHSHLNPKAFLCWTGQVMLHEQVIQHFHAQLLSDFPMGNRDVRPLG